MLVNILIGIAAVVILVLLLAAVMKKEYTLTSSIAINRSQSGVFDYVRHIKNQQHYSKWVMADPNVKLVYSGNDGGVGFVSSWKSDMKNVGEGAQEIIKIYPGKGYEVEIRFEKPFKGISYAEAMTEAVSAQETLVTTTFKTQMPFPMNIMIPMLRKMLLKDMEETSSNLKKVLEK